MKDDLHQEQWTELSEIDREPSVITSESLESHSDGSSKPHPLGNTSDISTSPFIADSRRGKVAGGTALTLGLLQLMLVLGIVAIFAWLIAKANSGVSGTEFMGLFVMVIGAPLVTVVAVMNVISLVVYFVRRRPIGKHLILAILSGILSVLIIAYGSYTAYEWFVVAPADSARDEREYEEKQRKWDEGYFNKEVTAEETKELLMTCQLFGFYYTNQTDKVDGNWGELSTTGVVLTYIENKPTRVSIADRLVPELVPVAREAQKTCDGPQLWHDGNYEQKQADGTWR